MVATVGAVTAIFAATMGLVQNDIKRVLAYSTVSASWATCSWRCGVGAFTAGMFHLMTHAFFKALLFLGSGSVIHAHVRRAGHAQDGRAVEQDSDHGEDVRDRGTIAIAGIPPLAGFFSKDAILGARVRVQPAAVGGRIHHRGDDGVLHVPPGEHDVLRRVARRCTKSSTTCTNRRAR